MKSCLGLIVATVILFAVIATGVGLWYLSRTTELSRGGAAPAPPAQAEH